MLVELAAAMLSDQLPATRAAMDIVAARFNDAFQYRWERVVDFLKLHYVLTQRTDTDYWRDNLRPESIPQRLQDLLELWRHQPPSKYDLHRVEEVFPSASYQYILYGMSFMPDQRPATRRMDDVARAEGYFREAADLTRKMLAALPGHREMLDHVMTRGMPRISARAANRIGWTSAASHDMTMANHALLNNIEHRHLRIDSRRAAALGDDVMSAPTFPAEFRNVQAHYPIVFHKARRWCDSAAGAVRVPAGREPVPGRRAAGMRPMCRSRSNASRS